MLFARVKPDPVWQAEQLAVIPAAWRPRAADRHRAEWSAARARADSEAERAANTWLRELADAFRPGRAALHSLRDLPPVRMPLAATDAEICLLADECARKALSLGEVAPGGFFESAGVTVRHLSSARKLRRRLAAFVRSYGIEPPPEEFAIDEDTGEEICVGITDDGALRRMTSARWWRRRLRKVQTRAIEARAVRLGYVHRRGEIYASDVTVERRAQQRRRNAAAMEAAEVVNEEGDAFTLAEVAARSVANPAIRRGELMVRIAGFEAVARGLGHVADFWTATTPSRMHAKRIGKGGAVIDNKRYDGTTPREAARYLSRTWAAFRAAAWRRGMRFYGIRIAEPHHDGTPHWHLLIFAPEWLSEGRRLLGRLRALFRRYFLRDSSEERGARENRCEFVAIDWRRGSAAGYVAKYVAKNIDGFSVQTDLEAGMDAVTASQRVEAWASAWGIRQFQQIGGPPVGVWRELRRLESCEGSEVAEAARIAAGVKDTATKADWGRFVEVMGGPTVPRKALPLRVAYTRPGERYVMGEPEPAPPTEFGEVSPPKVFGVADLCKGRAFVSRVHRWEIRRRAGNVRIVDGIGRRRVGGAGVVGNGRAAMDVGQGGTVGKVGATASPSPWSPVNNCSRSRRPFWWRSRSERFEEPGETPEERETRESWQEWRGKSDVGRAIVGS